jgi:hypothetical protein
MSFVHGGRHQRFDKNDRNYHNISIGFIMFTGICLLQYKHYLQEFSLIIFTTRLSCSRIGSFCAPSAGVHHSCSCWTTQRRPLGLFQIGCNVLCSWRTPPKIWCWRWCGHSTQKNGGTDPWEIASLKMKNNNDEDCNIPDVKSNLNLVMSIIMHNYQALLHKSTHMFYRLHGNVSVRACSCCTYNVHVLLYHVAFIRVHMLPRNISHNRLCCTIMFH